MKPKPPVPLWRWLVWWAILVPALALFYGIFTPFWMATRALAWLVDFKARRRPGYRAPVRVAGPEGAVPPPTSDALDR